MTVIIAEAGENHCGDMDMARRLIDISARAGADYVKFQMYDAARVADNDEEKEWFERVQLPEKEWLELAQYSRDISISPLCTPWAVNNAESIFKAGIDAIKIASFHTADLELLSYVNQHAKTVFLSTGMSTMDDIDAAVASLENIEDLYLLHCVSEYPLVPSRVNLRVIDTLKERFGRRAKIGYSDHTIGITAAVAAVARGAEAIEEHVTLGHDMPGTDHILSADPAELESMVKQIRDLEILLGSPEKKMTAMEAENQAFMRNRFRH